AQPRAAPPECSRARRRSSLSTLRPCPFSSGGARECRQAACLLHVMASLHRTAATSAAQSHVWWRFALRQRFILSCAMTVAAGCRTTSSATIGAAQPVAQPASNSRFDIAYRIAMPDPTAHLFDVGVRVANITGDVVRLQMPVWSPGRYARFDFARTVQDLTISGPDGVALKWERENGSLWRVSMAGAHSLD